MAKQTKVKVCRFCGKELTEDDPIRKKQCTNCSIKRLQRWYVLQAEAKAKFDAEWS